MGRRAQAKFRKTLYNGEYKASKTTRMTDYAMSLARQAKYLEPPMTDRDIIRGLKQHFDQEVMREIRPSIIRTIKDLMTLLNDIEDERMLKMEKRSTMRIREEGGRMDMEKKDEQVRRLDRRDNGKGYFNKQLQSKAPSGNTMK